ncbi:hypothetical protein D3C84_916560 [compost metagenome]
MRRAFQIGVQLPVALRHAQARVEGVDLDFVAALGLAAGQVVFNSEFKKPLGDADKLFRQGESVSQKSGAGNQQAQRSKIAGQVAGPASEKCRFRVHTIKKSKARADTGYEARSVR